MITLQNGRNYSQLMELYIETLHRINKFKSNKITQCKNVCMLVTCTQVPCPQKPEKSIREPKRWSYR